MDDKIMLSRREHRAVLLAIASHLGNAGRVNELRQAAASAGLSDPDIEAIASGGVPHEHDLANVVATTYLVLDKNGVLDDQDRFEVRRAGIGPLALQEIVQLSRLTQLDFEVLGPGPGALAS